MGLLIEVVLTVRPKYIEIRTEKGGLNNGPVLSASGLCRRTLLLIVFGVSKVS